MSAAARVDRRFAASYRRESRTPNRALRTERKSGLTVFLVAATGEVVGLAGSGRGRCCRKSVRLFERRAAHVAGDDRVALFGAYLAVLSDTATVAFATSLRTPTGAPVG